MLIFYSVMLPFFSFIIGFFIGLLPKSYIYINTLKVKYINTLIIFVSLVISVYEFYTYTMNSNHLLIKLGRWIDLGPLKVDWGFSFDSLSMVMILIVLSISFLVHLYSCEYMEGDSNQIRFFSYLSLFTFCMLLLVTADNFLQMFFGWEGVGFCSYLLINFWHQKVEANKASMKAFVINRIGDFSLIIAISLIYFTFYSLNFYTVFPLIPYVLTNDPIYIVWGLNIIDIICFFFIFWCYG